MNVQHRYYHDAYVSICRVLARSNRVEKSSVQLTLLYVALNSTGFHLNLQTFGIYMPDHLI